MRQNNPGTKRTMRDEVRRELGAAVWGMVRNARVAGLADRGIELPNEEACLVTRFVLEHLEGKRMSLRWVQGKTKQRWRYQAALEAAPARRLGYEQELK